jgi:hypothetical protein
MSPALLATALTGIAKNAVDFFIHFLRIDTDLAASAIARRQDLSAEQDRSRDEPAF